MDAGDIALSEAEFSRIRERVRQGAGIALSEAKRTLVVSRLSRRVRGAGFSSFSAYLDHLDRGGDAQEEQGFVNALTTNLTRFFREDHHFDHLEELVGALVAGRRGERGRLRIWSAGCSTGQEAYSAALWLRHRFPELARWDFRVLATDIDTDVLEKARAAIYPAAELEGLSAERAALFERGPEGTIRVPAPVRALVAVKPLNLMGPWPMKGPFDAIFCRNVAIYFDKPTQVRLFTRLGALLAPEGRLYIGHSETLSSVSAGFELIGKTIYRRKPQPKARTAA